MIFCEEVPVTQRWFSLGYSRIIKYKFNRVKYKIDIKRVNHINHNKLKITVKYVIQCQRLRCKSNIAADFKTSDNRYFGHYSTGSTH